MKLNTQMGQRSGTEELDEEGDGDQSRLRSLKLVEQRSYSGIES